MLDYWLYWSPHVPKITGCTGPLYYWIQACIYGVTLKEHQKSENLLGKCIILVIQIMFISITKSTEKYWISRWYTIVDYKKINYEKKGVGECGEITTCT